MRKCFLKLDWTSGTSLDRNHRQLMAMCLMNRLDSACRELIGVGWGEFLATKHYCLQGRFSSLQSLETWRDARMQL